MPFNLACRIVDDHHGVIAAPIDDDVFVGTRKYRVGTNELTRHLGMKRKFMKFGVIRRAPLPNCFAGGVNFTEVRVV